MPTQWIDFKELRKQLRFVDLARLYNLELKVKGDRAMALCPLPSHRMREDGSKRTASLSINLSRNLFYRHGCKASGNALDFVVAFQGGNPNRAEDVRTAALQITEQLGLKMSATPEDREESGGNGNRMNHSDQRRHKKHQEQVVSTPAPDGTKRSGTIPSALVNGKDSTNLPTIVNSILDFQLQNLDANHAYLRGRGFTPETIAFFGLGFCNRGLMKDRIAIPIHDEKSRLVGYAGRLIDDSKIDADHPKYRFPGERTTKDARLTFAKSELLYNAHRVNLTHDLIVVEGFASVWWLTQHGLPNVVAVMGSSVSLTQVQLILDRVENAGRVWIFPDEDPAGESLACDLLYYLSSRRWCHWVRGEAGTQPTDWTGEELVAVFEKMVESSVVAA